MFSRENSPQKAGLVTGRKKFGQQGRTTRRPGCPRRAMMTEPTIGCSFKEKRKSPENGVVRKLELQGQRFKISHEFSNAGARSSVEFDVSPLCFRNELGHIAVGNSGSNNRGLQSRHRRSLHRGLMHNEPLKCILTLGHESQKIGDLGLLLSRRGHG